MSRIFVFEIPDAVDVSGPRLARHVAVACPGAELRCSMSFDSWVKLNGYDKGDPVIPGFLPRGVDPKAVGEHIANAQRTPIEKRKPNVARVSGGPAARSRDDGTSAQPALLAGADAPDGNAGPARATLPGRGRPGSTEVSDGGTPKTQA